MNELIEKLENILKGLEKLNAGLEQMDASLERIEQKLVFLTKYYKGEGRDENLCNLREEDTSSL